MRKKIGILIIIAAIVVTSIVSVITLSAASEISFQAANASTAATTNSINPKFKIQNTSSAAINLADVKVKYYYTIDADKAQTFWCDHAAITLNAAPWYSAITSNVTGKFTKMAKPVSNADYCLEIGFTSGSLPVGATVEVQARFAKTDWSNYTQTGDYSFNSAASNYVSWDKMPVYIGGALKVGAEPGGVVTNPVETTKTTSIVTTSPVTKEFNVNIGSANETVVAGNNVTIPIKFSNVSKVNNCNFAVQFDASVFEFKSADAGDIIPSSQKAAFGSYSPVAGTVTLKYVDPTQGKAPISTNGVFTNLVLTSKSSAKAGTYAINVVPQSDSRYGWDFADTDLNAIKVNFAAGKVQVSVGGSVTTAPPVVTTAPPVVTTQAPITNLTVNIGKGTENVVVGKEVTVPITFTNVKAINNCNFAVQFDSTAFEFKSSDAGTIIPSGQTAAFGSYSPTAGTVTLKYVDPTQGKAPISTSGVFTNIVLTAKKAGTYAINVVPQSDSRYGWDFADTDLNAIKVNFIAGKVIVTSSGTVTTAPPVVTTAKVTTAPPVVTTAKVTTAPPVVTTAPPSTKNLTVKLGEGNEKVTAGSDITIPIAFANVKQINNLNFAIKYDANAFTFKSAAAGSIIPSTQANSYSSNSPVAGTVVFKYVDATQGSAPIATSGIFANIVLTAKSNASAGSYTITAVPQTDARYGWDFADVSLNSITVNFVDGKATVTGSTSTVAPTTVAPTPIKTTVAPTQAPTQAPTPKPELDKTKLNIDIGTGSEVATAGGDVVIPINFVNIPSSVNNLNFAVQFDATAFTFVSATVGSIIPPSQTTSFGSSSPSAGLVVFKYVDATQGLNPIAKSGTFATLTLKAKKSGTSKVLEVPQTDLRYGWDFADVNLGSINVKFRELNLKVN